MNLDVCGSKECAICLDTYTREDPRIVLICKNTTDDVGDGNGNRHCFHKSCITDWLRRGGRVCPSCRDEISLEPELIEKNRNYFTWYNNCRKKFILLSDSFMQFQLTKSISIKELLKKQSFSKTVATYMSKIIKGESKEMEKAKQQYDKAKQQYDEAKQQYDEAVKQIDTIDIPELLLPLHNFYKLYMDLHYNLSIVFFYYLVDIINYDIYNFLDARKIFFINKEKYERLKEKYKKLKKKNLEKVLEIVDKMNDATQTLIDYLYIVYFKDIAELINNPMLDSNLIFLIQLALDFKAVLDSVFNINYEYYYEQLNSLKLFGIFNSKNGTRYSDDIIAKIIDFVKQTEMNNTKTKEYLPNVKEIMRFISTIYKRQYYESSAAAVTTMSKKIDIDRAPIVRRASRVAVEAAEAEGTIVDALIEADIQADTAAANDTFIETEESDEKDVDSALAATSARELVAGGLRINRRTTKRQKPKRRPTKRRLVKRQRTRKQNTRRQTIKRQMRLRVGR